MTDQSTTESVMNLVHRTVQRVELGTSLATFLKLALKTAEDVVESETTLARGTHATAHAAHTNEPLGLHRRAALTSNGGPLTIKVERIAGTGGGGHVLVVAGEGIAGWILSELLLFRLGSGLSVLFVENAEDTGGDFVVNNSLVIFTHDVDAEFLVKRGWFV